MGTVSLGTFKQEDTTIAKYRIVKHGSNDQELVAAVGATAPIVGVADESASGVAAEEVDIIMLGVAKVVIATSGATKGDAITAAAGGKGATTTTKNNYCIGWLLETTTVNNQVAKVMVNPFRYPTVT